MKTCSVLLAFVALMMVALFAASAAEAFQCKDIPAASNWNAQKYLGRWFEIAKYNFIFEDGLDCVNANYSLRADGRVGINNQGNKGSPTGPLESAIGSATIKSPGLLEVTFDSEPVKVPAPYLVIEIGDDYSYAIVYSCSNYVLFHTEIIWILSRTPTLPEDEVSRLVYRVHNTYGFDTSKLSYTVQGPQCAYGPE